MQSIEDSGSYPYDEDFDDAGLLSAVHEAEAAKRQRVNMSGASLGNSVVHMQLPEIRTGWPQQTSHAVITELPQTPASGRGHSNVSAAGVHGRPMSGGRPMSRDPSNAPAADLDSSLSLVPVSAPQRDRRFEVEHSAMQGNVRDGQGHAHQQNSRPPDNLGQQQNVPHSNSDRIPSATLMLPDLTPPQPSPQPARQAAPPTNPYYVTHPQGPSLPSTSYQQQNPPAGNQRFPLRQVPENQIVPPNAAVVTVVHRNEVRCQRNISGGQENPGAAAPAKKKEPWLECPRASVFRSFQDEAMLILDPADYQMMQGKRMIKKTGWRKLGMFFGVCYEIKDFKDETDQHGDIVRSKFWVKAIMPNGRYCEATGSCDVNEKRFSKPNNDIPATAETRAKTRAVQDLLGIGEWKDHH